MKDLLDKLSTYNIFNYLFPGILYAVIASSTTSFDLIQSNLIVGAFVYYFFGLTISRIGSLMLEPLLARLGLIEFAPYKDFVIASAADTKVELLSETNNMYRTIIAMLFVVLFTYCADIAIQKYPYAADFGAPAILIFLLLLFVASFKKQTKYIIDRIKITKQ